MNEDKKKEYPSSSPKDNRFKSQDEFDNAPREDRKVEQAADDALVTSTAKPDPVYKEVAEEDRNK